MSTSSYIDAARNVLNGMAVVATIDNAVTAAPDGMLGIKPMPKS